MNIPQAVYAGLTAIERVRAAISAHARNDEAELQVLKETCPKRTFVMNDPDYSDKMPLIMTVLLATETDLRGDTLDFLVSTWNMVDVDFSEMILGRMATRHASLRLFAEAQGIDFAELEASGPPRHPSVTKLLAQIGGREDAHEAAEIADMLLKFVSQES